jgi:hypothetical protein
VGRGGKEAFVGVREGDRGWSAPVEEEEVGRRGAGGGGAVGEAVEEKERLRADCKTR